MLPWNRDKRDCPPPRGPPQLTDDQLDFGVRTMYAHHERMASISSSR